MSEASICLSDTRASWLQRRATTTTATPTLLLDDGLRQPWQGLGGCFNELGWRALGTLPARERQRVMRALFHPEAGCNLVANRVPIGASDYAEDWYSCNEHAGDLGMRRFSLRRDQRSLIPYIRAAQRHQPGMTLFASPWSPPTWMKQPGVYNSGRMIREPRVLDAYALYFARFVEGYRRLGIDVRHVHVQNEPCADQKFPSCLWDGPEMRDFIVRHLAPCFASRRLDSGIWVGTINSGDYDAWAGVILSSHAARQVITGVGYQWAGKDAVRRTTLAWPEMPVIQTENECGDGSNSWQHAFHVFDLLHRYITDGVRSYCYWNLVLAEGGVSTWGWRQNSLVTVEQGKAVFQPEYHLFRHAARVARPGWRVLRPRGPDAAHALAWRSSDGETGVLLENPYDSGREVVAERRGSRVAIRMPPRSFATLRVP